MSSRVSSLTNMTAVNELIVLELRVKIYCQCRC